MPTLSPTTTDRLAGRRLFGFGLSLKRVMCLLSSFGVFASGPVLAQSEASLPPSPTYAAPRIDGSSIKIDGVIEEAVWSKATIINDYWEFTPGENVQPPVPTQMLLAFDDKHLYVAAKAFDPEPERIRAHLMDRDAIDTLIQDDYVLVMIDTFNDHRRAFQFRVNPLGVQADALNGFITGLEDWSWDVLWDAAGRITDDGYHVEIRLPLNQLPFPKATSAELQTATASHSSSSNVDEQDLKLPGVWRIRLGRSWPRDQRHRWSSGPVDFGNSCGTCDFNEFSGFVDLKPGSALKIVPTVTAGRTDRREDFPNGPLVSGDEEGDLGLSGQWNVTQSTRLSFAVNPDFSQVEADAAQLQVNERFALFFPEQRPFFLEGVDIFNTPLRAVFTRTVADPDWGVKVTAKEGNNTLGVFAAQDNVNNIRLAPNQGSRFVSSRDGLLDDDVLGSVVRYRRDIGERNSLGMLYAGREAGDYSNGVVGVDGSWALAKSHTLSFQMLHSDTDYPTELASSLDLDQEQFSGEALRLNYQHSSREWNWGASFNRLDPGFRADSGFIPRVDVQDLGGFFNRNFHRQGAKISRWGFGANLSRGEDTTGLLTDSKIGITGSFDGPRQSLLFGQVWTIDKRNGPFLFEDLTGAEIYGEMQPSGKAKFTLYVAHEDEVDFANNREVDQLQLSPSVEFKIGKHVQTSLAFNRRTFSNSAGTYLKANLTELRFFYHFSTRSFVRAIVQHLDQSNDPSQFVFPVQRTSEDLFAQFLFSYKLNAQTVLFAGYSDGRVGNQNLSLTQTDRSVFLKLGYAFVL